MGALQLWFAKPEEIAETPERAALLEPYERAAQMRLLDARVGHEYFVTRMLARMALAKYLDRAPKELRFERSPHGKPELVPRSSVRFNLSNTKGQIVCLIDEDRELGVDVEAKTRGDTILSLAKTVFAHREQEDLSRLPTSQRLHHAVKLWTLKESYIKARGKGMALPLTEFSFRIGEFIELSLEPSMQDRAERWMFQTLDFGEHLVSCCVEHKSTDPVGGGSGRAIALHDLQTVLG
jgi:4'-phosphopantetheinyl transferase